MEPLAVLDAANLIGSVPNGWWRDRAGAVTRLRDALARRGGEVFSGELVLVVEGAARDVEAVRGVRVEPASGSGDDRIVDLVRQAREAEPDRPVTVVTADRALRERVRELGAEIAGPGEILRAIGYA